MDVNEFGFNLTEQSFGFIQEELLNLIESDECSWFVKGYIASRCKYLGISEDMDPETKEGLEREAIIEFLDRHRGK